MVIGLNVLPNLTSVSRVGWLEYLQDFHGAPYYGWGFSILEKCTTTLMQHPQVYPITRVSGAS